MKLTLDAGLVSGTGRDDVYLLAHPAIAPPECEEHGFTNQGAFFQMLAPPVMGDVAITQRLECEVRISQIRGKIIVA